MLRIGLYFDDAHQFFLKGFDSVHRFSQMWTEHRVLAKPPTYATISYPGCKLAQDFCNAFLQILLKIPVSFKLLTFTFSERIATQNLIILTSLKFYFVCFGCSIISTVPALRSEKFLEQVISLNTTSTVKIEHLILIEFSNFCIGFLISVWELSYYLLCVVRHKQAQNSIECIVLLILIYA